ncbi:MAG TPA: hypothetical protein ENH87_11225 [Pricia antarctica]|uniref:F5/8 type C domain-containing protein n=1 Tax=Pricia antarctica TaxID=641691 RepID=A0A831QR20_9FLAO|nr:hypothetical protein [Pricia antarctica]
MRFLSENFINTTTQIKVDSNTATVGNLFDRDKTVTWESSGYGTNTSTIISIEFDQSTTITHIILLNHNLKQFRVFYNSVTANVLSPDINETANSATANYYSFTSVIVNSVQLQMDLAVTDDTENKVGEFIIAQNRLVFTRNPDIRLFKPMLDRKQVRHIMPDGGVVLYNVKNKYKTKIGLRFITQAFHDSLLSLYEEAVPLIFAPFPTSTSWDGGAFPVVWSGDFDFKFSYNVKDVGFSGNITLEERTSV